MDSDIYEPFMECPICRDEFGISKLYTLECDHRYCFDCVKKHINTFIENEEPAKCPEPTCEHQITSKEVKHVDYLNYGRYESILTQKLLKSTPGFVKCKKCNTWMETRRPLEAEKCICVKKQCSYIFCSRCNEDYHYGVTCDEVVKHRHIWTSWREKGRQEREKEFTDKLQQFEKAKAEHEKEAKIQEQNFDILKKDEEYKAARAKRCPHCKRIVEKVAGCDSMVCGRDTHGANTQNGCGHAFNWSSAPPYIPEIPNIPQIKKFVDDAPQIAGNFLHANYFCQFCQKEIEGIRFSCIQCDGFNVCFECEKTMEHQENHVFRIFLGNEGK